MKLSRTRKDSDSDFEPARLKVRVPKEKSKKAVSADEKKSKGGAAADKKSSSAKKGTSRKSLPSPGVESAESTVPGDTGKCLLSDQLSRLAMFGEYLVCVRFLVLW